MQEDWTQSYTRWQTQPTTANLAGVVKSVMPTVKQRLASMGMHDDPGLHAHAQLLTAEAVKTWSPSRGAALPSWVGTQLTQLYRTRRNSGVMRIPERQQLDAMKVYRAEQEHRDTTGEDPTVDELADKTGLSVRRLSEIRQRTRPVLGVAQLGGNELVGSQAGFTSEALDMLYGDSDKVDKRILEHRMGYGGSKILDTPALMQKTKLGQYQIARRVMKLTYKLQKLDDDLRRVHGGGE